MKLPNILTIAGSDSSGGAGIQADIKTATMLNVYSQSVITAITAQNTRSVTTIYPVPDEVIAAQLDAVFTDVVPDAVKIGMLGSSSAIKVIADKLKTYGAKNIVLDPVMVSTSGSKLLPDEAIEALVNVLFPLATVITPNLFEAEVLMDQKIATYDELLVSGELIYQKYKIPILIKGGHLEGEKNDVLFDMGGHHVHLGKDIPNPNTHGTGCTLSSAIASNLAKGYELDQAVALAKEYVQGAIEAGLDLGKGRGPLNHMYTFGK